MSSGESASWRHADGHKEEMYFFIHMTNNLAFAKGFMHSLHSAGLCATLTRPVPLTINCWSSKSMTCLAYPVVYPLDKASGFSASISSCSDTG